MTLPAPDDSAVESILRRVLRGARKDFADAEAPWPQDEYEASYAGLCFTHTKSRRATKTTAGAP